MATPLHSDREPLRLTLDPHFQPCETQEGEELYPNGIFEFNITRLLAHIGTRTRFHAELVAISKIPDFGSVGLSGPAIAAADLSRPVILAEITPGNYSLIDGHHRVAKARHEGLPSILAHRIPCPEHLAFLTSAGAYQAFVGYWNSKVAEVAAREIG